MMGMLLLALAALPQASIAPERWRSDLRYVEASQGLGTPSLDGGPLEVEMGDVNGDGFVDLVSIGDHGSPFVNTQEHGLMVWFGSAAGTWSVFQNGNFGYGGVALGDFDGDGRMDAAYGMHHNYSGADLGDQLLEVALGDGTGRAWTPWDDGLATHGQSWGLSGTDCADVDGDGDLDVGAAGFGSIDGLHVYLNNGDGTWTRSFGFLGGNSENDFIFGDVNGDGRPDFATGHQSGTIWLGDGAGGFSSGDANLPPPGNIGRPGVSIGEVNGDGLLDLAYVTGSGGIKLWLRTAAGGWLDASGALPASGDYEKTQLADLNGDGRGDLLASGRGFTVIAIGDGAAGFAPADTIFTPGPGYVECLRAGADADRNGRLDFLLVADEGGAFNSENTLRFFREAHAASALRAAVTGPLPQAAVRAGSAQFAHWLSEVPGGAASVADVELSLDGPDGPWLPLAAGAPDVGRLQWLVPSSPTDDARLRVTIRAGGAGASAISRVPFRIVP
jgi:hypothetical protein